MLETLAAGVEELAGFDPAGLSGAELSDALVQLHNRRRNRQHRPRP